MKRMNYLFAPVFGKVVLNHFCLAVPAFFSLTTSNKTPRTERNMHCKEQNRTRMVPCVQVFHSGGYL